MVERMPDPPFRPSRLLNLNKASKANKEISALNSKTSPLLRKLSPEVRARIFGYALGGNTIHLPIDGFPMRSKAKLCECPEDYDDISDRCRFYVYQDRATYTEDHSRCEKNKSLSQKVAFNLLLSCRQIYHEGALLPFAKNRFVVRSYDWALVPNYLQNGLNPTQIRAIQHLIVRCTTVRPELSPGVALAQWSGLKTFEVVVKLGLSPELVVASLKTTSSTSAHNSSGKSRVPSVHVGVDFSNGWQPRTNNQRLGPPDSRTIDGIRSWQRGLESTLVVLPEQQRVEREAKEKAQKIAELAEEQAQKEQRAAVRSTRGLRNLEKKS